MRNLITKIREKQVKMETGHNEPSAGPSDNSHKKNDKTDNQKSDTDDLFTDDEDDILLAV